MGGLSSDNVERVFISACVIVKNEAENLPMWLSSVREFADEMVVVDTGSADNTKELAQAAGAMVFDFHWINDFSAAKNFAIERASGRWIAFLDADEYFDEASCKKIRPLLEELEQHPEIRGVNCPRYDIDVDAGGKLLAVVTELRLFRNDGELRYQGTIHEKVSGLTEENTCLARDLKLMHTGYSGHIQKAKAKRNLQLLEARQSDGENPLDWHYFMDCYYALADYPKTIEYAQKIISLNTLPDRDRKDAWENWASSCLKSGMPVSEVLTVLDKGLAEFPMFNRLLGMKGLCLYAAGEYEASERVLRAVLEMEDQVQSQSGDGAVLDSAGRLLPYIHARLGDFAYLKKKVDEALVEYVEALKLDCFQPETVQNFQYLLDWKGVDAVDQIELLNSLFQGREAVSFLAKTLGTESGKVGLYYQRKASLF